MKNPKKKHFFNKWRFGEVVQVPGISKTKQTVKILKIIGYARRFILEIMDFNENHYSVRQKIGARGPNRSAIFVRSILSRQNALNRPMEQKKQKWPRIQFFSFSACRTPIGPLQVPREPGLEICRPLPRPPWKNHGKSKQKGSHFVKKWRFWEVVQVPGRKKKGQNTEN